MGSQVQILLAREARRLGIDVGRLDDLETIDRERIVEGAPVPERRRSVAESYQLHGHDHGDVPDKLPPRLALVGDDQGDQRADHHVDPDHHDDHMDRFRQVPARPVIPAEVEGAENQRQRKCAAEEVQSERFEPEFHRLSPAIPDMRLFFTLSARDGRAFGPPGRKFANRIT